MPCNVINKTNSFERGGNLDFRGGGGGEFGLYLDRKLVCSQELEVWSFYH